MKNASDDPLTNGRAEVLYRRITEILRRLPERNGKPERLSAILARIEGEAREGER
jgi:hypothetical protein